MGRNTTGLPCSVGRLSAWRPARPLAGSITNDDIRQTLASKTVLAHYAGQYQVFVSESATMW